MPAKGRYFLNEGTEGPDQTALYEKYRLTSQHGPLLLTLLLVAITACVTLIVITFVCGVSGAARGRLGARLCCSVLVGPLSARRPRLSGPLGRA